MPAPTATMKRFAEYLLAGDTQVVAFAKAYRGKAHWKKSSIEAAASKLFHKQEVQEYYVGRLEELRRKEQEETGWTREEAMRTLRKVLDQNMDEQERCIRNVQEQIDELLDGFEDLKESEQLERLDRLRKLRSYRIVTATRNGAVLGAVDALNRMQGFNEETINVNAGVTFVGEEKLED